MKLFVNRETIAAALDYASDIVIKKTSKPALTAVKLVAEKIGGINQLSLVATDMELAMRWNLTQVDVQEVGQALIPAERLSSIVNSIRDDTISIDCGENDTTEVRSSCSKFKIFGYAPAEHPPVDVYAAADTDISIDGPLLARMIEQTEFAAAKEVGRYAVNAIYFELGKHQLRLVTTDGHRMAIVDTTQASGGTGGRNVPRKAISILKDLLDVPEARCQIQLASINRATFAIYYDSGPTPTVTISTSLLEGVFPSYAETIPKDFTRSARVATARFVSAIKQASLLTSEESKGVQLSFADKNMQISARGAQVGEATIDVPVDFTGEPMDIGFNPKYLLEYLATVGGEQVTINMTTPKKPALLHADANARYIIMPVNLT